MNNSSYYVNYKSYKEFNEAVEVAKEHRDVDFIFADNRKTVPALKLNKKY